MKWIRDKNDDLVNLNYAEWIGVIDLGKDYQEPFEVIIQTSEHTYVLRTFKKEADAEKFLEILCLGLTDKS